MRALTAIGLQAVTVITSNIVGKLEDWNLGSIDLFGSRGRVYSVKGSRHHVFGTRSRNSDKTSGIMVRNDCTKKKARSPRRGNGREYILPRGSALSSLGRPCED